MVWREHDNWILKYNFLLIYLTSKSLPVWEWERERERERGGINREPLWFTTRWDRYIQNLATSWFFHRRLIQESLSTQRPPRLNSGLTPRRCGTFILMTDLLDGLQGSKTSVNIYLSAPHSFFILVFYSRSYSQAIHMAFPLSIIYLKTQLHILFLKYKQTGQSIFYKLPKDYQSLHICIVLKFELLLIWNSIVTNSTMRCSYVDTTGGASISFQTFFVQAFEIVIDSR